MGTPQELTDNDGNIIWANYEWAWGGRYTHHYTSQSLNNCAILEYELQPIRFQGQFFDQETSLHYNRFRYYDSDVGMFIQRDPIGLLGGVNVFQYAPNPVMWIDPFGLSKIVVIGEGQKAVNEATKLLRKQGYDAESMMYPTIQWGAGPITAETFDYTVEWNKGWLKEKISQGYTIVDIGYDPKRTVRSPYYQAELDAISETRASKITLKKFANGETIENMRDRVNACKKN